MTLAGKKLQDIYDAGAETFVELEAQAKDGFRRAKEEHEHSMTTLSEGSSQSLRNQSSDLQTELRQLIDSSVGRLQKIQTQENKGNKSYALGLMEELRVRCEQMQSKLAALKQSHSENVELASSLSHQTYSSGVETAKIELTENAAQARENLNLFGATMVDDLLGTFEQSAMKEHSRARESLEAYFSTAKESSAVMSAQFSALVQTFSGECNSRQKASKSSAAQTEKEVGSAVNASLETLDKQSALLEQKINKIYAELTEAYFKTMDEGLSSFADELSVLHDDTTERLSKSSEDLANELLSDFTKAQGGLRDACETASNKVAGDFSSFKGRIEIRLQSSRGQKQTLEDDKNRILIAIKNELIAIQDAFYKKITELIEQGKLELADMTKVVDEKIGKAVEKCSEEIGNRAGAIQKQIEDDVRKFVQEILIFRKAAIAEITASAQGSTAGNSIIAANPAVPSATDTLTPEATASETVSQSSSELNEIKPVKASTESESSESMGEKIEKRTGDVKKKTMWKRKKPMRK